MSSAHQIEIIRDLTLEAKVVNNSTQGFAVNHPDIYDENGNKLDDVQLTGQNYAYSKPIALLPKYNDYIFTALCAGCAVTVTLQMSPDGVNWCDCVLSDGNDCLIECDPTPPNVECQVKIVDVPILQYIRVKIGNAASTDLDCTIIMTHTMNY